MYFEFSIKTRHMLVSPDNGKITRKEMSKLLSFDYDHYDMIKRHQNVNFEEIDTNLQQEKIMDFGWWVEF